jgi:hypothetical protein
MGFKEKLENNIIYIVLIVVIASSSATYGIVKYFNNQELRNLTSNYENKIERIESSIYSINRGKLEGESRIFNFEDIFITRSARNVDTKKLVYNSIDRFYSLQDTTYWKPMDFSAADMGIAATYMKDGEITVGQAKAMKAFSKNMYIWISEEAFNINNDYIFASIFESKLFPSIAFHKTNIDSLVKWAAIYDPKYSSQGLSNEIIHDRLNRNLLLELIYNTIELYVGHTNQWEDAYYEVLEIRKTHTDLYLKTLTTFLDQNSESNEDSTIYIKEEVFAKILNNELIVLQIVQPTYNVLEEKLEIYTWLDNFKVLTD